MSRVVSGIEQKYSTSPFLPWMPKKTTPTRDGLRLDGYGFTTCNGCSISHSKVTLVKRVRLGGIAVMPLLPLRV
jgi:hypothetical protein